MRPFPPQSQLWDTLGTATPLFTRPWGLPAASAAWRVPPRGPLMIRQTTGRSELSRLEGANLLGSTQTQVAPAHQRGSIWHADPWSRALRLDAWTRIPSGRSLVATETSRRLACNWAYGSQPNSKRPSINGQARGVSDAGSASSTASWWGGDLNGGLVPHLETRTRISEESARCRLSIGDLGFAVLSELTLGSAVDERHQLGACLERSLLRESRTHSTVGEEFRSVAPPEPSPQGPYHRAHVLNDAPEGLPNARNM